MLACCPHLARTSLAEGKDRGKARSRTDARRLSIEIDRGSASKPMGPMDASAPCQVPSQPLKPLSWSARMYCTLWPAGGLVSFTQLVKLDRASKFTLVMPNCESLDVILVPQRLSPRRAGCANSTLAGLGIHTLFLSSPNPARPMMNTRNLHRARKEVTELGIQERRSRGIELEFVACETSGRTTCGRNLINVRYRRSEETLESPRVAINLWLSDNLDAKAVVIRAVAGQFSRDQKGGVQTLGQGLS